MKKLLAVLALTLWMVPLVFCGERIVTYKELPEAAQAYISTHFADQKVVNVYLIQSWKSKEYKALLTNGGHLLFDKKGDCKGVFLGRNIVPENVIPKEITNHIAKHYPKAKVTEIQTRSNGNHEIKLTNGYHVRFNNKFKAIYTDIK